MVVLAVVLVITFIDKAICDDECIEDGEDVSTM